MAQVTVPVVNIAALGGAPTPEDAAKAFIEQASKGLAQVMADAIGVSLGSAVASLGGNANWTPLITGCVMTMDWGSPGSSAPRAMSVFAKPSNLGANPALGGADVSIGISIKF